MMMDSWRLQTQAKVLFSCGPLELSHTFRYAKWVRAQKPKDSYQAFCARTHSRNAMPLWASAEDRALERSWNCICLLNRLSTRKLRTIIAKRIGALGKERNLPCTLRRWCLDVSCSCRNYCWFVSLWCGYSSGFFSIFWLRHWVIATFVTPGNIFLCFCSPYTLAPPAWLTANLGFSKVECLI